MTQTNRPPWHLKRPCTDQELLAVYLTRRGLMNYQHAAEVFHLSIAELSAAQSRLLDCYSIVRKFVIAESMRMGKTWERSEEIFRALEDWTINHNLYLFRPAGGYMLHVTALTLSNSCVRLWYLGRDKWTFA